MIQARLEEGGAGREEGARTNVGPLHLGLTNRIAAETARSLGSIVWRPWNLRPPGRNHLAEIDGEAVGVPSDYE